MPLDWVCSAENLQFAKAISHRHKTVFDYVPKLLKHSLWIRNGKMKLLCILCDSFTSLINLGPGDSHCFSFVIPSLLSAYRSIVCTSLSKFRQECFMLFHAQNFALEIPLFSSHLFSLFFSIKLCAKYGRFSHKIGPQLFCERNAKPYVRSLKEFLTKKPKDRERESEKKKEETTETFSFKYSHAYDNSSMLVNIHHSKWICINLFFFSCHCRRRLNSKRMSFVMKLSSWQTFIVLKRFLLPSSFYEARRYYINIVNELDVFCNVSNRKQNDFKDSDNEKQGKRQQCTNLIIEHATNFRLITCAIKTTIRLTRKRASWPLVKRQPKSRIFLSFSSSSLPKRSVFCWRLIERQTKNITEKFVRVPILMRN